MLRDAVATLSEDEQLVIRLRFGLDDGEPKTLDTIAGRLGVSRETTRKIQMRALDQLHRLGESVGSAL